ncbi:MAG: ABC transporter permease [Paracoccaceae bacterium]
MTMTLRALAALQIRVIGALILRETRATFGASRMGYLWAIIGPAAGITLLVFIFARMGRQPPFGGSLALFFATGILTLDYFNRLSAGLMRAFAANRGLFSYPVILASDVLFARFLLISATYVVIMALFYGGLIALGLADAPRYLEHLVAAFLVTGALGFGFGTLNAVIAAHWPSWAQIERVLTRPLFFLSGVFYVPSLLPPDAIAILRWNPLLHLIEWFRLGYYAHYDSQIIDIRYPLALAALLIVTGLGAERLFRRQRGQA